MVERIAQDGRNLTMATATGVGIAFGGEKAYQSWLASWQRSAEPRTREAAIARQNAAIERLARLFGSQPNPALRNAIQIEN